jgi:hypothetical protein
VPTLSSSTSKLRYTTSPSPARGFSMFFLSTWYGNLQGSVALSGVHRNQNPVYYCSTSKDLIGAQSFRVRLVCHFQHTCLSSYLQLCMIYKLLIQTCQNSILRAAWLQHEVWWPSVPAAMCRSDRHGQVREGD